MQITILNGNPDVDNTLFDDYLKRLSDALASDGHTVTAFELRAMDIKYCNGCWGCWVKTPGECAVKDESRDVRRAAIHSDLVLWASPVIMGFYSALLKKVADKFIQRGVIVSTRGRSTQEDFTYSAHAIGTWRVPLVVLIDQDTASAAEIFAGAVREHRRGTIVGARSYGKGSVQGIFPLDLTGAGVRLTTAKFYSPSGRPYSRVGVQPDVLVHLAARPVDGSMAARPSEEDAMLAAALQVARGIGQPKQARNLR